MAIGEKSVERKLSSTWKIIYPSYTLSNQCNPTFKKSFIVHYFFERVQPYRFRAFDWDDNSTSNLSRQEFIGQMVSYTILHFLQG